MDKRQALKEFLKGNKKPLIELRRKEKTPAIIIPIQKDNGLYNTIFGDNLTEQQVTELATEAGVERIIFMVNVKCQDNG